MELIYHIRLQEKVFRFAHSKDIEVWTRNADNKRTSWLVVTLPHADCPSTDCVWTKRLLLNTPERLASSISWHKEHA